MKKLIFIIPVLLIAFAAIFLIYTNSNKTETDLGEVLTVVSAENFYGDIAKQLAGSDVKVINILANPNQDPHEYEATSQDARNITDADIIIQNGLGYDPFIDNIVSTMDNADQKELINVGELTGFTENDNPHIWYRLAVIREFAHELKDRLMKVDSNQSFKYEVNYNTFINSLDKLDATCQTIKTLHQSTKVIATERVGDYLLQDCGLSLIPNDFQKAVEEENDPSIQATNFFENALKTHVAKVLIYNEQTESPSTEQMKNVAKEENIPVVGFTETMPITTTYQTWILNQLKELNSTLAKI